MNDSAPDPSRCPLCGASNRCAMETWRASAVPQGPCWCVSENFPSALLARLPAQAASACICPDCVARHGADLNSGPDPQ